MAVDWSYYDDTRVSDMYLPARGEGETKATQLVTAINKLIYKWYNDGDVYDNTYQLSGWLNDLSSYANWLYKYIPRSRYILTGIEDCFSESDYEDLLRELYDELMDPEDVDKLNEQPKEGSIYNCDGPFKFEEYDEDESEYDEEEMW